MIGKTREIKETGFGSFRVRERGGCVAIDCW